jgi:hypothetical protein
MKLRKGSNQEAKQNLISSGITCPKGRTNTEGVSGEYCGE